MSALTVLLLPPTGGPAMAVEISGTQAEQYAAVKGLVGGWLEVIVGRYLGESWVMFLNEDGKREKQPVNENATRLATLLGWRHMPGDVLVGTVVLAGKLSATEISVQPVLVRAARELEIAVLAPGGTPYDEEAAR